MKRSEYIKDCWRVIFLWLFTAGLLQILLYLFQVKKELMILAAGIQILGLAGMLLWEYRRKNRFYRELGDKMENLEEKYLIPEMIKAPDFLEGRILYDTVEQMGKGHER